MPVRNGSEFINSAISSIRNQTFSDWELLVIDDGSTDDTCQKGAVHAAADDRVRIHSIGERGLVNALNEGIETARGDIIARMDVDDLSLPDRLEKQRFALRNAECETVVSCIVDPFPVGEVGEGMLLYVEWLNSALSPDEISRNMFIESPIAHPSAMFYKKTVIEAGGYKDYGWPEDYDLWMRLFLEGVKFSKVPEVLYKWRDREERLSRTSAAYSLQAFRKLKAHYLLKSLIKNNIRDIVIWGAGKIGRWWCRELISAGFNILCFIDDDEAEGESSIGEIPIFKTERIGEFGDDVFFLACVGTRGVRDSIRNRMTDAGFEEISKFIMLA